MPSIDQAASSRNEAICKSPEELPHGFIAPPAAVRHRIELERAKHPPEVFAKHEERLLNEWTIGYIFDSLCQEVIYRPTPAGPEVLAVGTDETITLKKTTSLADQMTFETFLGYP